MATAEAPTADHPTPSTADLKALLSKAIRLLDQELDLLEPGQRVDLIKVLTELRHQIAALVAVSKAQDASTAFEGRVLSAIRAVDERLWLEVVQRLEGKEPPAPGMHDDPAET
ncbi:MAG TPA: hypothetical protein VEI97_15255 [bacterium]|nr:hypothetical protein [bacterium]